MALMPFIKRKMCALFESVSFLMVCRIFYVLVLEALSFTMRNNILYVISEYFLHRIMTRREPFVIGLYLFVTYIIRDGNNLSAETHRVSQRRSNYAGR